MHRVVTIALTIFASLAFGAAMRDARPTAPNGDRPIAAETPSVFPVASTQLPTREWTRPLRAPNGSSWPQASSYLVGYWVGRQSGVASLTIDAERHPSDALVRLYDVAGGREVAVRTAFVAGGERFTFARLDPGTYELRYRALDTGALTRSQRFTIAETDVTIALHAVRHTKIDPLATAELRFADAIEPDLIGD